jgi:hypothetical protein
MNGPEKNKYAAARLERVPNYQDDTILTPEKITSMKEGETQIINGEYMTLQDYKNQRGL